MNFSIKAINNFFQIKKYFSIVKNNTLKIETSLKQSRINIKGQNNFINIKKAKLKRLKIAIYGNNNLLEIDKNCSLRNLDIIIQGNDLKLIIKENTYIAGAHVVCAGKGSSIIIEKDCFIGSNIEIRNNDGHTIFENGKVINESRDILIQENVWICENVKVLKGANIGSNSVVALNALVSCGGYDNNVILAGVPAKIIKRDITWSREMPN